MSDGYDLAQLARLLANSADPRSAMSRLLDDVARALLDRHDDGPDSKTRRLSSEIMYLANRLRDEGPPRTMREEVDQLRAHLVRQALDRADDNVALAARMLGVSRNLIYDVIARSTPPQGREC